MTRGRSHEPAKRVGRRKGHLPVHTRFHVWSDGEAELAYLRGLVADRGLESVVELHDGALGCDAFTCVRRVVEWLFPGGRRSNFSPLPFDVWILCDTETEAEERGSRRVPRRRTWPGRMHRVCTSSSRGPASKSGS